MTRTPRYFSWPRSAAALCIGAATLAALGALSACAPVVVGGVAVGSAMVVTDRRTTGAQVEDQGIELKAPERVQSAIGDRGHVNVTSYNRMALVTGEVPAAEDRAAVEQALARLENVRSIVNELAVMGNSSFTARSNDSYLTGRVKAAFLDVDGVESTAIKVVTERSTTYLMGRVTDAEARKAAEVARAVQGVQKVVRVFEIISEAELAALKRGSSTATPTSGPPGK